MHEENINYINFSERFVIVFAFNNIRKNEKARAGFKK